MTHSTGDSNKKMVVLCIQHTPFKIRMGVGGSQGRGGVDLFSLTYSQYPQQTVKCILSLIFCFVL